MEGNSQYCIFWNNYHSYLAETMKYLQQEGQLVDVTIVTSEGSSINAHQVVLAACSVFFRSFIKENSSKQPVILLPTEIKYPELKAMIEFMYTGQVCIQQDRLQAFIRGARYFRIKGLEDSTEDSDGDDLETSENEKGKIPSGEFKRKKLKVGKDEKEDAMVAEETDNIPTTTIKGRTVKDHRYTQHVDLGDSDENREKWEVVDRKPVIFPLSKKNPGNRKRRRKLSSICKVPMHLSNNIICYEQKDKPNDKFDVKEEPINKVRRPGFSHEDEMDICTCAARKIWSVRDTEALLDAWMETLNQVPPSYFIRSMSLCRRVSKKLQQMGILKNWKQCQVKMKNLRREVRLYKESVGKANALKKSSEVANACEKLLTSIEEIFNKEESIRREWYQKKGGRVREDTLNNGVVESNDILAQVAVMADSDMGDEDTDVPLIEETEGEGEGGTMTEGEEELESFGAVGTRDVPHHQMHTGPDGTVVHHIVEDISLHHIPATKRHHSQSP